MKFYIQFENIIIRNYVFLEKCFVARRFKKNRPPLIWIIVTSLYGMNKQVHENSLIVF